MLLKVAIVYINACYLRLNLGRKTRLISLYFPLILHYFMASKHGWEDFYVGDDVDFLDFSEEDEMPPSPDGNAEAGESELFCHCKMPETGEMIACTGSECPGNNWYHFQCVGIDEESVPNGDWFCLACSSSNNPRKSKLNVLFVCKLFFFFFFSCQS